MCDYLEQPGIKGSIRFILISKFEKPLIIGKNKIQKVRPTSSHIEFDHPQYEVYKHQRFT